ncbi:LytTr DNA-binding domain-containing protein [Paenibacillus sophorae]|uniref:LytTR family transcriptional regulator DNA-binding domain-containing protein n=1 Tax=Paenibacillus sophorae TaxID=1333845 RepID=A0A1H8JIT7_9BACL|nr:LytTR family DNA-binding domain-containing protein [Paenibacillus sophorae]QWU13379.1 LytTR family transcriptional regulator DNA-binding domain-containing protein [Paenibacillus sophorae]SEN80704.1 LytTr DNA-binding domain-containing protein [Paenibacillus sophorae]
MSDIANNITVYLDPKGKNGLAELDINKITYMELDKTIKSVVIHTLDNVYYINGSLTQWTNLLINSGFDFVRADRNTLINVKNVVSLDKDFNWAFFDDERKKHCLLSENGYKMVKQKGNLNVNEISLKESPSW